mmetsp:Transcript_6735/g.15665  ORF Transcript_6735/g.15665 Transcript_6735/m.15665 type:complete len:215 (+) Transcript_6735:2542-3186(+)
MFDSVSAPKPWIASRMRPRTFPSSRANPQHSPSSNGGSSARAAAGDGAAATVVFGAVSAVASVSSSLLAPAPSSGSSEIASWFPPGPSGSGGSCFASFAMSKDAHCVSVAASPPTATITTTPFSSRLSALFPPSFPVSSATSSTRAPPCGGRTKRRIDLAFFPLSCILLAAAVLIALKLDSSTSTGNHGPWPSWPARHNDSRSLGMLCVQVGLD